MFDMWPAPLMMVSSEPGMSRCICSLRAGGVIASSSPTRI